jgi:soluble lytic murein transglycosylase
MNRKISGMNLFRCLFLTVVSVLCVLVTELVCMTVSSGPAQEYLFKEGKRYYDGGELERARETWENIFPDGLYGPVAYLLLSRSYLHAGKPERAEALITEFFAKHRNSPYQDEANRIFSEALCRQVKKEAVPFLLSLLGKGSERDKPALTLRLAEVRKRLGNHAEAATNYRTLFLNFPATVEGLKAADELAWLIFHGKIPPMKFSDAEQMGRASKLYGSGRFDLAADVYTELLKAKPGDKSLTYKLAQCRFKERQNHRALTILKGLVTGEVEEKQRIEALYLTSLVHWRLNNEKDFESCCNKILASNQHALKKKVLFNLAAHNLERGRLSAALRDFDKLLASNPDPSVRSTVKWKTAWIKYLGGEYAQAAEAFREARKESSSGKIENPSKYWQARSLMQANRPQEAQSLLKDLVTASPMDYYGIEADRVLRTMNISFDSTKPAQAFPDTKLSASESSHQLVASAQKLMELGLDGFALKNLEALPKSMKSSPAMAFLIARAAYGAGQYRAAYETLSTNFAGFMENPSKNAPGEFVEMAFPRVHFTETSKISAKHSVDPHLVWALIRQESRYDPSAVSPAGALGLMQVTPEAAGLHRIRGKIPPTAIAEILDPKQNLNLGVRILAKNLASFNGKLIPAVASYNADARKVREWIRRNGKLKDDEFIENIPFLETRLYVKKVLAGYRTYSMLYRKKDLAGLW